MRHEKMNSHVSIVLNLPLEKLFTKKKIEINKWIIVVILL